MARVRCDPEKTGILFGRVRRTFRKQTGVVDVELPTSPAPDLFWRRAGRQRSSPRRPGQAQREPGPITPVFGLARGAFDHSLEYSFGIMGPRFRGDDDLESPGVLLRRLRVIRHRRA